VTSWHENPTIAATLGAIAGAVVTAAISLFTWQKANKIRRVDCIISDVSSLLSFSDTIRNKLEVLYAGERASTVFLFNIEVFNSGTLAIGNQPIQIRIDRSSKIVGYSVKTEPEVGFGVIHEDQSENYALDLNVELLNPGDRVFIELISVNNESDEIDVYMKNANVVNRIYTRQAAEKAIASSLRKIDPTLMSLAIMRYIPILGGVAVPFLTVVLIDRFEKALKKRS
jgi:hypothetical protein